MEKITPGSYLRSGDTKSCGCLNRELIIKRFKGKKLSEEHKRKVSKANKGESHPNYKHGFTGTTGYNNNEKARRYRAKKLNQTPKLTEIEQNRISFIYRVCSTMADHHVGHIQPLSNGGLHHPNNLQTLEATLNLEKNNKYPLTEEEEIKYKGFKL